MISFLYLYREKQHRMLYGCINEAIVKLESSFAQNLADFVGVYVEVVATDQVIAEEATEEWKTKMLDSCGAIIIPAQRSGDSPSAGAPDMVSTVTGTRCPPHLLRASLSYLRISLVVLMRPCCV
jgi:hypothetical protein